MIALIITRAPAALAETAHQASSHGALLAFLRNHIEPQGAPLKARPSTATKVQIGWKDLNGDGRAEALVYILGRENCGSGGCKMLVLEQSGRTFRVRADLSVTRLPVAVLQEKSHGWRNLTVLVGGGGVIPGYRAVLPFDGQHYPENPSVEPAYRLKGNAAEQIIIGDSIFPFFGEPSRGARGR